MSDVITAGGTDAVQSSPSKALIRRILPLLIVFLVDQFIVRLTLALRVAHDYADSLASVFSPFIVGAWFDLAVFTAFAIPVVLWWLILPQSWKGGRVDRVASLVGFAVFVFVVLFDSVAEHLFWTEFGARFNFIAVDYLVYTHEVIGNIWESYPVARMLIGISVFVLAVTYLLRGRLYPPRETASFRARIPAAAVALGLPVVMIAATSSSWAVSKANAYESELSLNGIWSLFSAFRHNEINYRKFYATRPDDQVHARMVELNGGADARFVDPGHDQLTRVITHDGPMLRKNVVLVGMESMGAEYSGLFGNSSGLTPNLDRLAREGLLFTNLLATGNRTVRGLEALTLSVPPTPGQSILRRPGNEGLYSLGWVFKERGYDTRFIYGGYGYFDNMNAFFSANGFDVTDRTNLAADEIHFSNVWGVSDEDLFNRVIKEADASHAAGKHFFDVVMTTSNHRPFTYPDGKIDIRSKSGRLGGVKYADYAVGAFIAAAKSKPWFADTVFIFVGDHTAGTSGKVELDPTRYHIMALMYAPELIKPQRYERLMSQIDIGPTLLGLLKTTYRSRFYGKDVLNDRESEPRAFIGIYQKVALVRDGKVAVLGPKREIEGFDGLTRKRLDGVDKTLVDDAIAYYQYASDWIQHSRRIDSRVDGAQ
ncbi:MAG: LTA synthase family protein [Hyphomicrobiaceae bacterium]